MNLRSGVLVLCAGILIGATGASLRPAAAPTQLIHKGEMVSLLKPYALKTVYYLCTEREGREMFYHSRTVRWENPKTYTLSVWSSAGTRLYDAVENKLYVCGEDDQGVYYQFW